MANILDYITWRGDLSFRDDAFNDVDNLILCSLSYIGFDGAADWESGETVTLSQTARWFEAQPEKAQHVRSSFDRMLLRMAGESGRFGGVRLARHENKFCEEKQLQFCATTFLLDDTTAYVAFRGTDSTLVGWKEDFNMAFLPEVPAQLEAAEYLSSMGNLPRHRLYVGGHSKGGNLAVFAAVRADAAVQNTIAAVYANDAPGFGREFLESPEYRRISGRIHAIVPQTSVIGRLLEHGAERKVIHSSETGLQQHDPYSWEVLGPDLVAEEGVTAASEVIDRSLKSWLDEMNPEEREEFFDQVYLAMRSTNVETLREFNESWAKNSAQVLRAWQNAPQETRRFMAASFGKLFTSLGSALTQQLKTRSGEKLSGWEETIEERLHRPSRRRDEISTKEISSGENTDEPQD